MKKIVIYIVLSALFLGLNAANAGNSGIRELKILDPYADKTLKSIRNDIKKTIYVIKSRRPAHELPELQFFMYTVKKDDTFWTIMAKCSLDIDTLLSINGLSTPKDVTPGKKIYIANMRGIIISGDDEKTVYKIIRENTIGAEYVLKINRCADFNKKHIFIPGGKISNLERSLFLGTGFMHPLQSRRDIKRISGFGMRKNPFDHRHSEFHAGVDVPCPRGSEVLAARDGTIVFTGYRHGYGNLVIAEHECGYQSFYGHLAKPLVRPGDTVKRGAVIALSGNTGRTTGPHLHFEVRRGKTPVHPGVLLAD
jgi:murein DD-endopeptidase MepM/ murein hydrolase activator NlpD